MIDKIRSWLQDMYEIMWELRARFDENMLGKCGQCGLEGGHKMDCTREWVLERKWNVHPRA